MKLLHRKEATSPDETGVGRPALWALIVRHYSLLRAAARQSYRAKPDTLPRAR